MEYWFVILLTVIAVAAIAILLFFELMGDDAVDVMKRKHHRGKYINDQTAVIYQSIKDTVDSEKAYSLFVEYIFTNNRMFIEYLKAILMKISGTYNLTDIPGLEICVNEIKDMKVELKDQKISQMDCLESIDQPDYVESSAWIHLSNNCRFSINEGLHHLTEVCIYYASHYSEPFPKLYNDQLEFLVGDVCNICDTCLTLIGTRDITGMRELRKRMSIILDESYTHTQRLYELIHDGRNVLDKDRRIALKYCLNAFQELHTMIYTLRRFVLANLCITLSIMTLDSSKGNPYPHSPIKN